MSPRRPVRSLAVTIVALGCSALVPATAGACANPATVKSFQGQAYINMALSATGTSPGAGGLETATLQRRALGLHVHLNEKLLGKAKGTSFFAGTMTGGSVSVKDELEGGEDGSESKLVYDGPLAKTIPDYGRAEVVFSRKKCQYDLELSFGVKASFEGDGELDTDPEATVDLESGPESLPHSLHLADSGNIRAYLSCLSITIPQACATFGGTWTSNFATLFLCGSVVAVNCKDDTLSVGTVSVGWTLKPIMEKKKKK